jgi:hypothetical protein
MYKDIEKARKDVKELAKSYDVPESSIVWRGDNKYIVVKDGKEIYI